MDKTDLKFIHHAGTRREEEWYEVLHRGVKVLTIRRKEDFPNRWVAIDMEGKQCFEPNQYRNDLFEEIEYEGDFE